MYISLKEGRSNDLEMPLDFIQVGASHMVRTHEEREGLRQKRMFAYNGGGGPKQYVYTQYHQYRKLH